MVLTYIQLIDVNDCVRMIAEKDFSRLGYRDGVNCTILGRIVKIQKSKNFSDKDLVPEHAKAV